LEVVERESRKRIEREVTPLKEAAWSREDWRWPSRAKGAGLGLLQNRNDLLKFRAPVRAAGTLRARVTVKDKRPWIKPDRGADGSMTRWRSASSGSTIRRCWRLLLAH